MITQVKVSLSAPENVRITPDFAYNLYGAWMDLLRPEEADYLHESHVMNQYLTPNGKNAILTANLLTDEAADCMVELLQKTREYPLTKQNCTLTASELKIRKFGEDDLVGQFFTVPQARHKITLYLVSPTTFRSNDRYTVFPSPELILHSALKKWNALGMSVTVDDEEAASQLMQSTMITDYQLSSTRFCLKDTRIQSYYGRITLSIHGAEPMVRLFDMLMNSLRFTGLGVKTSLGMGGVEI